MKKSVVILLIICVSPPFIFLGYFFISDLFSNKTSKEVYLEIKRELYYNFVIDTIYRDRRNHNALTLQGKNVKEKTTTPVEWEYNHFQVGDSIVKYKDSLQIYIYRNQKLDTVLDYNDIWIRP